MSVLLDSLSSAVESNDERNIIESLNRILTQGQDIELKNKEIVKSILPLQNVQIQKLAMEVIAEWCKIESNRKLFTDKQIIQSLLPMLEHKEEEIILHTIRVLGNICYENEEARKLVHKQGLLLILKLLNGDDKRENTELTLKASGFLVNLLMSNDELQKIALEEKILNTLENLIRKYIKSFDKNETLFTFLLIILDGVVDFIDDLNIEFPESLCLLVIELFKLSEIPKISVPCLEILHSQSDKDEIKIMMAQSGYCELVFQLIEKYKSEVYDEDSRFVLNLACDLIVIILTGDESMNILYDNGKGKMYENMITWLDSEDSDLLSTGVLAIGNFARKDTHCIQMVENGISKKLIGLLSKYNLPGKNIKVQHALLSTLKNLVVPQENKAKILEEGLIDVIYPMTKIDQFLVVFKLLGTLRMVIDGQEKAAFDLLSRKEFVEKLIFWCYNSDHLGVRGEVPRLISWLIKHCHSFKPLENVIAVKDCVKCLVEMISSNHAVMQNESFYALYLLCRAFPAATTDNNEMIIKNEKNSSDNFFEQLINANLGKNLQFVINKYSDKMDEHTIENLLTLLEQLLNSPAIVDHLVATNVVEALNKLKSNANLQGTITDKLVDIMNKIHLD